MNRAFLSHNSFDKDFVGEVFDLLGAGKCVYDKQTFKKNCDLTQQIKEGLDECSVYVLFLSKAALESRWVSSEVDVAESLKTEWKVRKVFVFQLDDTPWSDLPTWLRRYVVSCPPSPAHVALRLLDELKNESEHVQCIGRSKEETDIITQLTEMDVCPSYIFLSGPVGIGRKTLIAEVYNKYYKSVNHHKIQITMDSVDGLIDLYRKLLPFSSNWRARQLREKIDSFAALSESDSIKILASLIHEVSIDFQQVVIVDLGTSALTADGRPQPWFLMLTKAMRTSKYPYVWFLSQRFLNGFEFENGLFYSVDPLSDKLSSVLFRILIKNAGVSFPNLDEQKNIEESIAGHPGLIAMVAKYLKLNPRFRPNKTHNNIVSLINTQVNALLFDFIGTNIELEKAVAFFAETHILSYEDIQNISLHWPSFDESTSALIDAGLLIGRGSDYSLASYTQRTASTLAARHRETLSSVRRLLLTGFDKITEDSYISTQLLDARIIEHIIDGAPISSFLSNLIMPSQQIKAARRKYDAQDYSSSLSLAQQAYVQSEKLSQNGKKEAWRLIGLSSVKGNDQSFFEYFESEYRKITKNPQVDAIFYFANGLKERMSGNLRNALGWYQKIKNEAHADSHVYRELSYIYAFERNFSEANAAVNKALSLAYGNPYILDIQAMILLESFKVFYRGVTSKTIDECLELLKQADQREDTNFYQTRSRMRDVIIHGDISKLNDLFVDRRKLPISAKVALLNMLSIKGKDQQYDDLRQELIRGLRERANPLANIEMQRVHFEHLVGKSLYLDAHDILEANKHKLTETCVSDMMRQLQHSKGK